MKKILASLLVAVFLLVAPVARADTVILINDVIADTSSEIYEITGYKNVAIHVEGIGGDVTGTFEIKVRTRATDDWNSMVSWTNPTDAGKTYLGPGIGFVQIVTTVSAGTLRVVMVRDK